ncbi:MAG: MutS protein msh4 [Claussenomyces sp. TS43310]|nr:MAG: MutS protein msh4 [Claussenomyces sp. TS43310]
MKEQAPILGHGLALVQVVSSVIGGGESQQIVCAVSEGRGVSPTVGLAFINLSTGEAVLSQVCDNQFYVRTVHKLQVFEPTEILMISSPGTSNPRSKMNAIVEEEMVGSRIIMIDRKYWSETAGLDYINQLAFLEDVEAIKVAIGGNYFATCCLAALILYPARPDIRYSEQSINNVLILKTFALAISPLHDALANARSSLLLQIKGLCKPERIQKTIQLIDAVINPDVSYQKTPLDLQNQRTYAVKSGVNGLLDVARQTYKEATEDVHQHVSEINQHHEMQAETRYDNKRRYYLRVPETDFEQDNIPEILINRFRRKSYVECQTLHLMKLNQRIEDSHQEVILMSDKTIQELLEDVRGEIPALFRVCEGIALLDMIASFSNLVTLHDYCRPELTDCLAISAGRHPIREAQSAKFVPNGIYATQQSRFQIITGCNMSGKSTYIRSVALLTIMAQIGSFVPAQSAYLPIIHQLFARISMDNSVEANVSTFAAEMRETAFILRNINAKSLVIIDELGRGTSTRDGLAIALSIAEALVDSHAFVWFATHFRELAQILQDRPGVLNRHLAVNVSDNNKMTMLYELADGYVEEVHYGLALARAIGLPNQVLEVAEKVSASLVAQAAAKKRSSRAAALVKRRKVVLALREQLKQARDSPMEGQVLTSWLRRLQEAFVRRMEQIEAEAVRDDRVALEILAENPEQEEEV